MNFRQTFGHLGTLLAVLGALLLVVAGWSGYLLVVGGDSEESGPLRALLISGGLGVVIGGLLRLLARGARSTLGRREAFLLVALSWMGGAVLSAVPFWTWSHFASADAVGVEGFGSFIDCYFEAMSGLTTTGATILTQIDGIPRSILLWRAATNWLGGLGIIVLFVAVLPTLGVGGKKLFQVESPGPRPEGVRPHIVETARVLWMIYVGLTIAEIIALRLAGIEWFDAVCHTFATLATGGFSTHNASVGALDSASVYWIIIVFMVLAGVNFGLYYHVLRGRFRTVARDTELRCYLGVLLAGSALVCLSIMGLPLTMTDGTVIAEPTMMEQIQHGVFTTVAIQTTTGFTTSDFNQWPFLAKAVLIVLMFVGASAGSTGGGIKIVRLLIMFKVLAAEIERAFRPTVVRPLKIAGSPISDSLRLSTLAYVLGIILLFGAGAVLLMLLEPPDKIDFTTAATASIATLCNIGPGLARVGAIENYAWFTDASKVVMIVLMALGRLEIFAIIVLFQPRFWRGD